MPLLLLVHASEAPAAPSQPSIPGAGFLDWHLWRNGVDLGAPTNYGSLQKRGLSLELIRGGRGVLTASYVDVRIGDDPVRVDMDEECIFEVDSDNIFGGYVTDIAEQPISGFAGGTRTPFKVGDYAQVFDRLYVTANYGSTLVPILNASGAPAGITTDGPHGLVTGDRVRIDNHISASPDINGDWIVTVLGPVNFTIPVNLVSPGGGGTVRRLWALREVIDSVFAAVLAPWGFTRNADLEIGPLLDPLELENAKISDLWNHITDLTGYINRTDGNKVVTFFLPGTRFASFSLEAGINVNSAVQFTKTRSNFANRIFLEIGGERKIPATQNFVATGTAPQAYTTAYPASPDISDPWPNVLIVNGAVIGPVSWGPDVSFRWYWDPGSHSLVDTGSVMGADQPAGAIISIGYTQQFPITVMEQDPVSVQLPPIGKGPWEKRIALPTILNIEQARELARGILRRSSKDPRRATLSTLAGLALPGDVIPVNVPSRRMSGQWIVESVKMSLLGPKTFNYEYALTEDTEPVATWQDSIKELTGRTGTLSGTIGGTVTTVSPTYPPSVPTGTGGHPSYFLGAATNFAVQSPTSNAWVPANGGDAGLSGLQVIIDQAKFGATGKVRVRVRAADAGVNVQARLFDVDANAEVGIGTVITDTDWVTDTFDATINAGAHAYELQIRSSTANADIFAVGYIE